MKYRFHSASLPLPEEGEEALEFPQGICVQMRRNHVLQDLGQGIQKIRSADQSHPCHFKPVPDFQIELLAVASELAIKDVLFGKQCLLKRFLEPLDLRIR